MTDARTDTLQQPVIGRDAVVVSFDYADIAAEEAERLQGAAAQIRMWRKSTIQRMISTGVCLLAAKQVLGHGRFTEWLEAEFGWTDRTARNYMLAAEAFEARTEIISDLPATVVYQLASPSTPAAAREAVVSRLLTDKHVPLDDIRDIIADARQQDKAARAEAKKTANQRAKEAQSKARREARQRAAAIDWNAETEARTTARTKAAELIVAGLSQDDIGELLTLLDAGAGLYPSDIRQAFKDQAPAGVTQPSAQADARAIVTAFEEQFWPAYPRKDDKGRARKAFLSVIKSKKATVAELVNGAMRYAAERENEDPKYTKQPATWLNAEAWLNTAPPALPSHRLPAGQPQSRSQSAMAGILSYGMDQEAPYVDGPVIEG